MIFIQSLLLATGALAQYVSPTYYQYLRGANGNQVNAQLPQGVFQQKFVIPGKDNRMCILCRSCCVPVPIGGQPTSPVPTGLPNIPQTTPANPVNPGNPGHPVNEGYRTNPTSSEYRWVIVNGKWVKIPGAGAYGAYKTAQQTKTPCGNPTRPATPEFPDATTTPTGSEKPCDGKSTVPAPSEYVRQPSYPYPQPYPAPSTEGPYPQPYPAPSTEGPYPQPYPAPSTEGPYPQPYPAPSTDGPYPQPYPAPSTEGPYPQPYPAPSTEAPYFVPTATPPVPLPSYVTTPSVIVQTEQPAYPYIPDNQYKIPVETTTAPSFPLLPSTDETVPSKSSCCTVRVESIQATVSCKGLAGGKCCSKTPGSCYGGKKTVSVQRTFIKIPFTLSCDEAIARGIIQREDVVGFCAYSEIIPGTIPIDTDGYVLPPSTSSTTFISALLTFIVSTILCL